MSLPRNLPQRLEKEAGRTVGVLQSHRAVLALAESCTGGLCAAALTEIPGVSSCFSGGYVVYSNEAKQRDLSVPKETLEKYGAVSSETVSALLRGLLSKTGCSIAAAVSGIAGPDGGSAEKPVGTVFIGTATASEETISRFFFRGNRSEIRCQAALELMRMLVRQVT